MTPPRREHMRPRAVEACLVAWTGTLQPPSLHRASELGTI